VDESPLRRRLEQALRAALRRPDATATSALRSALAAIDNAGAVTPGPAPAPRAGSPHVAGAAAGVGAAETTRRRLGENQVEQIVRSQVAERRAAARDYERAGHADRAGRLRREASALESALQAGVSGEP
jgi:uncharacterized protein